MKNKQFSELLASIEEAGKIKREEVSASRLFEFPEPDVKSIRESVGFSQSKFASLIEIGRASCRERV